MDILKEAHRTPYTIHPGETKIYRDLKPHFLWKRMKVDIAKFVASCGVCQQVKVQQVNYNPWRFQSGSGSISLWILWLVYLVHHEGWMLYGSWWIGSLSWHIL
jgi:hypothetical protein